MTKSFTNSGQFKKGHVSWSTLNKGKYHFPKKEWNLVKGNCKICNKEFSAFLSKKKVFCSTICQYKARIGVSCNKGKIAWNKGLKGFRAGEKRPNIMPLGEEHWSWKGGISKDHRSPREPKYKEWRTSIFKRDNWKCKISNENCLGELQAHHILPWRDFVELRYEINNGITLCQAHHPRKRAEEKRLIPTFMELVSASKYSNSNVFLS